MLRVEVDLVLQLTLLPVVIAVQAAVAMMVAVRIEVEEQEAEKEGAIVVAMEGVFLRELQQGAEGAPREVVRVAQGGLLARG